MRLQGRRHQAVAGTAAIAVAAASLLTLSSVTDAAWTDDEYVGSAAGVMIAGDCSTTTLFQTQSAARQLSGLIGAQDLDSLAALQGLAVENSSGTLSVAPDSAVEIDPVTFSAPLTSARWAIPCSRRHWVLMRLQEMRAPTTSGAEPGKAGRPRQPRGL
ncbi:hypothetical protein ACW0JT_06775 [Arthrobacter sp. SA17]